MNKYKAKHHRKSDTKTANKDHTRTTAPERPAMKSTGFHFYKYCYASNLSLTSAIITMFALQRSLKTKSR